MNMKEGWEQLVEKANLVLYAMYISVRIVVTAAFAFNACNNCVCVLQLRQLQLWTEPSHFTLISLLAINTHKWVIL